jgi:hypothetical protein
MYLYLYWSRGTNFLGTLTELQGPAPEALYKSNMISVWSHVKGGAGDKSFTGTQLDSIVTTLQAGQRTNPVSIPARGKRYLHQIGQAYSGIHQLVSGALSPEKKKWPELQGDHTPSSSFSHAFVVCTRTTLLHVPDPYSKTLLTRGSKGLKQT